MQRVEPEIVTSYPLRTRTPGYWADDVLREPLTLLSDHAYLEKKAALNALELLNRWPDPACAREWSSSLASIADDEASHLSAVVKILTRRRGHLERNHRNPYASALRGLVRQGMAQRELLDRLLVSALIEVRSCERFEVLASHCLGIGRDAELGRFYQRLGASERGHFTVFLRLAEFAVPRAEVDGRWEEMLDAEAAILAAQPAGPRIHSGLPGSDAP
jgi:tRNA-(ms[2]io[6]A)-hydroxylase